MIKYLTYLTVLFSALSFPSCIDMMKDAQNVKDNRLIEVSYRVVASVEDIDYEGNVIPDPDFSVEGLRATFVNTVNGETFEGVADERGLVTLGVYPGLYNIFFQGEVVNQGRTYYMNGTVTEEPFAEEITPEEALASGSSFSVIRPALVGPLCLSELYYCGTRTYIDGLYWRDQTYHIYNNGDEDYNVAGLCLAQLFPSNSTTVKYTWPEEDGLENYVYAGIVFMVPTDAEYILKPGEAMVIAQKAMDHTTESPLTVNNYNAEWEAFAGTGVAHDTECPNLENLWKSNNFANVQWLAPVFGGAYVIFTHPDGGVFTAADFNASATMYNGGSTEYTRIHWSWIMDGVELLPNMGAMDQKRVPGYIDGGAASTEETYVGRTVGRRVIDRRADGTPIYQDTNNSTEDFIVHDYPAIRRNGEKMPAWNWTLNN